MTGRLQDLQRDVPGLPLLLPPPAARRVLLPARLGPGARHPRHPEHGEQQPGPVRYFHLLLLRLTIIIIKID